jgi:hypothetical protein
MVAKQVGIEILVVNVVQLDENARLAKPVAEG